jgi:hypothetical protein
MNCASCEKPLDDIDKELQKKRRGVPNNYCATCSKDYRRWTNIKRRYKISKEQYLQIIKEQDEKCVICHLPTGPRSVVDHCHASGVVRGVICNNCNLLIGLSKEDKEILERAIEYLNKWKIKAE